MPALTRNRDRADDLVQDTILLAKEHLWQPDTDLRAWLFTLMHNQNVNFVRRGVREGVSVDVDGMSASLVATADPTVSCQLAELDRALAQLSEDQRQVILLIGLDGAAYEEAAEILGIPVGTVRSRLSRARESRRWAMGMFEEGASAAPTSLKDAA